MQMTIFLRLKSRYVLINLSNYFSYLYFVILDYRRWESNIFVFHCIRPSCVVIQTIHYVVQCFDVWLEISILAIVFALYQVVTAVYGLLYSHILLLPCGYLLKELIKHSHCFF